jgi:predicted MFS family arabinose efflux permease
MPVSAALAPDQRRTLATLSAGAFASQASIRLCDPLLPQLSQQFGRPIAEVASAVTAFAVAYGLMQLVHGPMGDRYGKLRVVRVMAVAAALASLACAFAADLGQLVALRFVAGATCAALIPLSLAWIGDSVPYEARQQVLARFLTGSTLGVVFGQVAGGLFADTVGWRATFLLPAIVLAAVALAFRRDPAAAAVPVAPEGASQGVAGIARQFAQVLRVPWARFVIAVVFVEGVFVFGAFAFVPTWLHVHHGMPLWQCGLAAAGFGVGGFAYALSAPWLIPRLGEIGLALGGATLFAVGLIGVGGPWWPVQAVWCAFAGLGFLMLHNTLQTLATQMAPHARGTAIAAFAACLFAGQSGGVALGARLVETAGYRAVFVGAALLLCALAAVLATALRRRRKR